MRVLKRIAQVLLALALVGVVAMLVKFYGMSPKVAPAKAMQATTDPEVIARGEYLTRHVYVCTGCHSPIHDDLPGEPLYEDKLAWGRDFGEMPGFPGHIRAANLTNDKSAGIGAWSDGEVVRAMREGVDRDGRALFPMMPYPTYAKVMSDDDALAVVAYLRSLTPSANDPGRMTLDFPVSMFIRAVPKPLESSPPPAPPPGDPKRGEWLLVAGSCADCHTTYDARRAALPGMYMAGGNEMPIRGKGSVYTANITSDPETGIGNWTDDDVFEAIKHGIGKTKPGRALYGMPWPHYGGMTDQDVRALVTALRKVPPIRNAVKPATIKP
jgi:mono/diheme cytochrome c family protein